ncbi:alpha-hydroxy acid oxidase [Paralcaligenes ureilyticus]|uniref:(S)-mandelate dehydrogenase n=1 Tax=Paralcaligenes ureilyticus TaxID=627131 RepID=A0A4R3LRX2_9BURK|nr:alpha-hydroxy acid oxidase [Paralcaligenes ureilyticus]TCT03071.1 (S)-mandelate dehydrogenase [Paralcaligenes ureilyticus]
MQCASVSDYREWARWRLPKLAFDYLDKGAGDGDSLENNVHAFRRLQLRPRVLVDVTKVVTDIDLFGHRYSAPLIVGPTGLNGLYWPDADSILAKECAMQGLPFVLSTAATDLLEDVRKSVSDHPLWFQLYVHENRELTLSLIARAKNAGYSVLVLTVDVPVHGKRDHDIHNEFRLPLRPSWRLFDDILRHPRWAIQMLTHGTPQLVNIARSLGQQPNLLAHAGVLSRAMDKSLTWNSLDWLRDAWTGPIVLKGIQSEDDARRAQQCGFDGIVLSNHGGRQLSGVSPPIDGLEAVAAQIGDSMKVFVDGGVRRGEDIVKARALGASAVLTGRAPLYGLAANGKEGARDVLKLFLDELHIALQLVGCPSMNMLGREYLR